MPTKQRFIFLDGLRGMAALAVMVYHFGQDNSLHLLPGAWVAVDMFFVMSGFVIDYSYSERILSGMTFYEFARSRFIRLAPMYYLGLCVSVLDLALRWVHDPSGEPGMAATAWAFAFGGLWLPYFNDSCWPAGHDHLTGNLFPLVPPAWSLFFEMFVNAVFFVWVPLSRVFPVGRVVVVLLLLFLGYSFGWMESHPGYATDNFLGGFPRVMFGFFLGVWFFRLQVHRWQVPRGLSVSIVLLGFGMFFLSGSRIAFANSVALVPLVVALGCGISCVGVIERVFVALGTLSYPLYILHMPLYKLSLQVPWVRTMSGVQQTLLLSGVCILVSWIMVAYDTSARGWLSRQRTLAVRGR